MNKCKKDVLLDKRAFYLKKQKEMLSKLPPYEASIYNTVSEIALARIDKELAQDDGQVQEG